MLPKMVLIWMEGVLMFAYPVGALLKVVLGNNSVVNKEEEMEDKRNPQLSLSVILDSILPKTLLETSSQNVDLLKM